jgi:hypothetical protein
LKLALAVGLKAVDKIYTICKCFTQNGASAKISNREDEQQEGRRRRERGSKRRQRRTRDTIVRGGTHNFDHFADFFKLLTREIQERPQNAQEREGIGRAEYCSTWTRKG